MTHQATLEQALSIWAEPLVAGARVLVVTGRSDAGARLSALGARSVHAFDPAKGELDVRDGAFDVVLVPDVGVFPDTTAGIRRLRRLVSQEGAIVAVARALVDGATSGTFPEVAPAKLEYAQMYDVFALQFEHVVLSGLLPFDGIVFAELGQDEDVAVSVDTQLAPTLAPDVFVIVASHEPVDIEPYAIVQTAARAASAPQIVVAPSPDLSAQLVEAQLRADTNWTQLEHARRVIDGQIARERTLEQRVEKLAAERDAMITRATELEGIAQAAQQAIAGVERRLAAAEQGLLERDDRIAALQGELDAVQRTGEDLGAPLDEAEIAELVARAERAESALALHVQDLAHVAEAHASETHALEAQLRERARVIAAMEKELVRREQLVRELVASLEEAREDGTNGLRFEAAPPMPAVSTEEGERLKRKIDELALEIARREGELVAREWRIAELESSPRPATPAAKDTGDVGKLRDELDALRQALAQEHAARVAAESGEELARARAELARQAALLDQIRARGTAEP